MQYITKKKMTRRPVSVSVPAALIAGMVILVPVVILALTEFAIKTVIENEDVTRE